MQYNDTITALATAPGPAAIAIIRLSGRTRGVSSPKSSVRTDQAIGATDRYATGMSLLPMGR